MTKSSQISDEMNAFRAFVSASKEPIEMSSVESKRPPEPDIACRYLNGSSITFEMVELLDPDFKRTYEIQQGKVQAMYAHLDSMPLSKERPSQSSITMLTFSLIFMSTSLSTRSKRSYQAYSKSLPACLLPSMIF